MTSGSAPALCHGQGVSQHPPVTVPGCLSISFNLCSNTSSTHWHVFPCTCPWSHPKQTMHNRQAHHEKRHLFSCLKPQYHSQTLHGTAIYAHVMQSQHIWQSQSQFNDSPHKMNPTAPTEPNHLIHERSPRRSMGLPCMPISWSGFGGQCRHIWHTWSVWVLKYLRKER